VVDRCGTEHPVSYDDGAVAGVQWRSMRRGREILAWVLLTLFGLLLGIGLIEGGVRALHLVQDRFWELDPLLGVRHIAGKSGWWTQEGHEFRVPIQINAEGLRDVEHTYEKPPGVQRVLLLGDSFIEALQVPLAQSLGRRLAKRLGPGIEVISAGVSGYGTASELLFLQKEGWRYDPDVVVLAFYTGNDVKNNSSTLEDILPPVYDGDGRLLRVQEPAAGAVSRSRKSWHECLYSYRFTRQLVLEHPALAKPLHRLGLIGADGLLVAPERAGVPVDYWIFAPNPSEDWQIAWQHTDDLLSQMRRAVASRGRQFVVMVIPSRYQIYPELWRETISAHPAMRERQWDLDAPARRVMAWCAAHRADCLDLSAAFLQAARGSARLYFHFDGHWTAAGHRLAARELARFLESHQLLREQSH
jgi:lysophospholipase L1-like esterase